MQLPLALHRGLPSETATMRRLMERLHFDDALEYRWQWRRRERVMRIEYLYLERGFPHYRVYVGRKLIGAVYIRHKNVHERERTRLAAHLIDIGVEPSSVRFVEFGAKTSPRAKVRDLPRFHWDEIRLAENRSRHPRKRRAGNVVA